MMRLLTSMALLAIFAGPVWATSIGLAMSEQNIFLDMFVAGVQDSAKSHNLNLVQTNANNDTQTQINQVHDLIAKGVSAILTVTVSKKAEIAIAEAARAANIPLIYVNREPNREILGGRIAYVGSDEMAFGKLQAEEVCRLLGGRGKVTILIGELTHPAAKGRTMAIHQVLATPDCHGIEVLEEQSANWNRIQGEEITRSWLAANLEPDAILANNDEMALGAVIAVKAAGARKTIVVGVDATKDAIASVKAGDMRFTILQDAANQGRTAVEVALKSMAGQPIEPLNWVPIALITPETISASAPRLSN